MRNNVWIKLTAVSLVGLLVSSVVLMEINGMTRNRYNNGYTVQQRSYNNRSMGNGMNFQGGMNWQQAQHQQSQGRMIGDGMPGDM